MKWGTKCNPVDSPLQFICPVPSQDILTIAYCPWLSSQCKEAPEWLDPSKYHFCRRRILRMATKIWPENRRQDLDSTGHHTTIPHNTVNTLDYREIKSRSQGRTPGTKISIQLFPEVYYISDFRMLPATISSLLLFFRELSLFSIPHSRLY